jgi:hypothetical protein
VGEPSCRQGYSGLMLKSADLTGVWMVVQTAAANFSGNGCEFPFVGISRIDLRCVQLQSSSRGS